MIVNDLEAFTEPVHSMKDSLGICSLIGPVDYHSRSIESRVEVWPEGYEKDNSIGGMYVYLLYPES